MAKRQQLINQISVNPPSVHKNLFKNLAVLANTKAAQKLIIPNPIQE